MEFFDSKYFKQCLKNNEFNNDIASLTTKVELFFDNFLDDYQKIALSDSYYFCNNDGTTLNFNPLNNDHHQCSVCLLDYRDESYHRAWLTFYRLMAADNLFLTAIIYLVTNEKKYLDYYLKYLDFYAINYLKFRPAGSATRLFDNKKNEALFTIRILNSVELMKDKLDSELLDKLKSCYFDIIAQSFALERGFDCHLLSALGMIGLFYQDKRYLDCVFESDESIYQRLTLGVTSNGLWQFGSLENHFDNLEVLLNLLLFSKIYNYSFDMAQELKIAHMLICGYNVTFDNGNLPRFDDCNPQLHIKDYQPLYALAVKVFGSESEFANIYHTIKGLEKTQTINNGANCFDKSSGYELLFIKKEEKALKHIIRRSRLFNKRGLVILRSDKINLALKYGQNEVSDGHHDLMNLDVTINNQTLTSDLGNVSPHHFLYNDYFKQGAAHNTVVVNGQNVSGIKIGKIVSYTNSEIVCSAKNLTFNNQDEENETRVDLIRSLTLKQDCFEDVFFVNSPEFCSFDFIMHLDARLTAPMINSKAATINYENSAYRYLTDVKRIGANSTRFKLEFLLNDTKLQCTMNLKNKVLYLATSFGYPLDQKRTTLIVRYKGKRTKFIQKWEIV